MNTQHMKLKWRTPSTMNTNHTSLYDGEDASGYTKPLFDIVSKGHEEKARRIAACVNACAGIVNPEIKIPQLKDALIESVEQLQKAEQQNAKLLATLQWLHDACGEGNEGETLAAHWVKYITSKAINKAGETK